MKPTDISQPDYFQKVVDCQSACPAHTPVPHYIRLIAERRYAEAYMVNWEANVFPGILGRTCDRSCEPACRRRRVEKEPVAICRLKRAVADCKAMSARSCQSLLPGGTASTLRSSALARRPSPSPVTWRHWATAASSSTEIRWPAA